MENDYFRTAAILDLTIFPPHSNLDKLIKKVTWKGKGLYMDFTVDRQDVERQTNLSQLIVNCIV